MTSTTNEFLVLHGLRKLKAGSEGRTALVMSLDNLITLQEKVCYENERVDAKKTEEVERLKEQLEDALLALQRLRDGASAEVVKLERVLGRR